MNCTYCGFFNDQPTDTCGRCEAQVAAPSCRECGGEVDWGEAICESCVEELKAADQEPCPSCNASNSVSAEYCTSCGSPMAVITRVVTLGRAREREPLETWRVYGIETHMVGRDAELERLYEAYRQVLDDGVAQIVGLTGPTGLGKSRLLAEFQRQLNEQFAEAHLLHAESRDESAGRFSMFARLFKGRFYIAEKEHPASARRKLLEAVQIIVGSEEAERIAHLVGQIIDLPFEDSPHLPSTGDSEEARDLDQRAFEALTELLRADAEGSPLVILLEDLQYATSHSLDLIAHLTTHLRDEPILFVLSWNPEDLSSSEVFDAFALRDTIDLKPLADDEVEHFVRDTLRKAADVPARLVEEITDSAHGNPLSVEEMLRILISQGIIDTRHAEWVVHEEKLARVELPRTMEGAVQARLESLGDEERRVLAMAATIGDVFWPELVRCLYHLHVEHRRDHEADWNDVASDARLDELLEALERKDMIRHHDDSLVPGHTQMAFKHRIERATIYEAIPSQERHRYHRLAAQWLDRQFHDDPDRIVELVAHHWDRARCLDHAARKYLQAARLAQSRYAHHRAIELYVKGLAYLSDADIDQKLRGFHDLGTVYDLVGEHDQALAYFREMLRYSWILNDHRQGGIAYNRIGKQWRALGAYDRAMERLERALELFRDADDTEGLANTLDEIGKIHWIRGAFDDALHYYRAALQLRRELDDRRALAVSLNHIGALKLQRGALREAMVCFREGLEIRRAIDDRKGVVESYNNLGALLMERGEPAQALTLFEEALELARDMGLRGAEGVMLDNIGEVHLELGDYDEARRYLEESMKVVEESGEKRVLFDVLRNLGKVAMKQSDRTLALERLNEAMAIAGELDSQQLLGMGMQSLAQVHAELIFDSSFDGGEATAPGKDLAEECFRDAIDLLRGVGNEAELGRCLAAYGRFLVERGQVVLGRKNLEQAAEIFDRLELRKLWEATEQVIKEI